MDFYESLYKYDLEIQEKITARLKTFLQNISNSTDQIREYQKSANSNFNFLNNINQLISEINQSEAFKSKISNTHKIINRNQKRQRSIKKDLIYAKDISECNENYSLDNNNKNYFNQKFITHIIPDKNSFNKKLVSDINKLICDSIIQNVKNKFLIEINNKNFSNNDASSNISSFRERCCSENSTKKIPKETNKIKNINPYQYIQNYNTNNNYTHYKNKLSVQMNLRSNIAKNTDNNNKLNSESPFARNLINISENNIKIKPKTTSNINHNNKVKNSLSNFSGSLLRLKEYNTNNVKINNEFLTNNNQELNNNNQNLQLNRHSIKFNELKRRNKETQIQVNNKNAYTNKFQKIFPTNKNKIDELKNLKIFEHGQKILIKNIKLNNPITNREQSQTYKNMYIKKSLLFQQIGNNNDSNNSDNNSDNQKSKKRICVSPGEISRNKNINLVKFKRENNDNLNLHIDSEINNLILAEEKSERNRHKNQDYLVCKDGSNLYKNNVKTYAENSYLNNNNETANKKRYLIRNKNKIGNDAETINFNMKKSNSKEVTPNFRAIKNLGVNNNSNVNRIKGNKERDFNNMRAETNNDLEKKKRLYSVTEKRILSSKIHIRGREDNKFLFWN